jgi:hypothetical protein
MFWPPGYPFILAAVYKLWPAEAFGNHEVTAAVTLNAAFGAATVVLVYAVARRAFDSRVAIVAALIAAFFPSLVFLAGVTLSETAFTFFLLLAVWLLIDAETRSGKRAVALVAVAGFVTGFAALIRGPALLLPVVAVPFWLISAREPSAEGARNVANAPRSSNGQLAAARAVASRVAIAGGLTLLVVAPWTLRNFVESGSLVAISSNAGVDFYIGHSEGANGRGRIVDEFVFRYPELPPAEAEARVSADGLREGLEYAVTHPLGEVELAARKVFWLYSRDDEALAWTDAHGERELLSDRARNALAAISNVYYWLVVGVAVAGLALRCSVRQPVRILLASLIVYWTLVHVAFFADPRFHAPIVPVFAIWAAAGLVALTNRQIAASDGRSG